jgi:hypothetical protein
MAFDQRPKLRHHLISAAERELRLGPGLEQLKAELV